MTWSLRRTTDQGLPASHTVEIMFKLPPVTNGFFLIGLSAMGGSRAVHPAQGARP